MSPPCLIHSLRKAGAVACSRARLIRHPVFASNCRQTETAVFPVLGGGRDHIHVRFISPADTYTCKARARSQFVFRFRTPFFRSVACDSIGLRGSDDSIGPVCAMELAPLWNEFHTLRPPSKRICTTLQRRPVMVWLLVVPEGAQPLQSCRPPRRWQCRSCPHAPARWRN